MLLVLCRDFSIFQKYFMFVCLNTILPLPLPLESQMCGTCCKVFNFTSLDFCLYLFLWYFVKVRMYGQPTFSTWLALKWGEASVETECLCVWGRKRCQQFLWMPHGLTSWSEIVVWLCWSQLHHIKLNACHHFSACQRHHFGNGSNQFS